MHNAAGIRRGQAMDRTDAPTRPHRTPARCKHNGTPAYARLLRAQYHVLTWFACAISPNLYIFCNPTTGEQNAHYLPGHCWTFAYAWRRVPPRAFPTARMGAGGIRTYWRRIGAITCRATYTIAPSVWLLVLLIPGHRRFPGACARSTWRRIHLSTAYPRGRCLRLPPPHLAGPSRIRPLPRTILLTSAVVYRTAVAIAARNTANAANAALPQVLQLYVVETLVRLCAAGAACCTRFATCLQPRCCLPTTYHLYTPNHASIRLANRAIFIACRCRCRTLLFH